MYGSPTVPKSPKRKVLQRKDSALVGVTSRLGREKDMRKRTQKLITHSCCVIPMKQQETESARQGLSEGRTSEQDPRDGKQKPWAPGWGTWAYGDPARWSKHRAVLAKTRKQVAEERREPHHLRVCSPLKGLGILL